jgi:glycosyltransferase involved in cell wall biosynthesis
LIENKTNEEVLNVLNTKADILVEQLVMGYGLSAIEGMSAGIPVLTNLDDEHYTRVFRRYSYLNECPILSVTPENIEEKIKILVLNPKLRRKLGTASREYVKKYHSYESAKYMFNRVYEKIWFNKDVDLMNMYHPLHPDSYNNKTPLVKHPLVENKIPDELMQGLYKY